jgi:TRAP-type C4-dicarboxylate transport system permease small subunit
MSTSLAITVVLMILFVLAWLIQPARNPDNRPPIDQQAAPKQRRKI